MQARSHPCATHDDGGFAHRDHRTAEDRREERCVSAISNLDNDPRSLGMSLARFAPARSMTIHVRPVTTATVQTGGASNDAMCADSHRYADRFEAPGWTAVL